MAKFVFLLLLVWIFIQVDNAKALKHRARKIERCTEFKQKIQDMRQFTKVYERAVVEIDYASFQYEGQDNFTLNIYWLGKLLISLNLTKSDKKLVDSNTPVWAIGKNDTKNYIYQKTFGEVMAGIDHYIYYNVAEKAAIIVFFKNRRVYMEGFIGNRVLKYKWATEQYTISRISFPVVRFTEDVPIETESYSNKAHSAKTFDLQSNLKHLKLELLVALDWSTIRAANLNSKEILKSILLYFTAADLLFDKFSNPNISIKIAGVLMPSSENTCPFTKAIRSGNPFEVSARVEKFFRMNTRTFPYNSYDIIIGMTVKRFCVTRTKMCDIYASTTSWEGCFENDPKSAFLIRHPNFQGGFGALAQAIGHSMGAKWSHPNDCSGIMASKVGAEDWPLDWSSCSVREMSDTLRSASQLNNEYYQCFLN